MEITSEDVIGRPFQEILDEFYGPIGTPERDKFEAKLQAEARRVERREARREKMKQVISPIFNAISGKPEVVRI